MSMPRTPLTAVLASNRDSAVCETRHGTLGWPALRAAVRAHAVLLQNRPEQRWLLVHEHSDAFVIGLFALLAANKQVILPPNAQPGTLAAMAARADALLGTGECQLPTVNIDLHAAHDSAPLPALCDTLSLTLLTSGSTGEPQWIVKTLAQLDAEITALEQCWGSTMDASRIIATASHQHIYGLLFRLLWPLCSGRIFQADTHSYPEALMADLQHGPCVLVSSPAQLKRFSPSANNALASQVRAVFSSGGPLPANAAHAWQTALGHAPVEVFGSTETGGIAWRQQMARQQQDSDRHWHTLPGVAIQASPAGLLHVQSPWSGGEQTLADCITLHDDTRFSLLGRADRIVKLEEKRLSLDAMEHVLINTGLLSTARLLLLPGQREQLACVSTPTPHGQTLLQQGKTALQAALRETLLTHYERVLLPRKWRFADELPTNAQGKITQAALVALFTKPLRENNA